MATGWQGHGKGNDALPAIVLAGIPNSAADARAGKRTIPDRSGV